MNLVAVADQLKGLADNQLVKEMQAPTGLAPQFLVLSELQRRKQMRASALSDASGQQNTTTPLSQEIPQQLAGLNNAAAQLMQQKVQPQTQFNPQTVRQPNAPQGYAGGGLVSFADGGSTDAYPAALDATIPGQWPLIAKDMDAYMQHPGTLVDAWKRILPKDSLMGFVNPSVIPPAHAAEPGLPSVPNQLSDELAAGAPSPVAPQQKPPAPPSGIAGLPAAKQPSIDDYMKQMDPYLGKPEAALTPEQAAQQRIAMNKMFGVDKPALSETEAKLHEMESGIQERKGERVGLALLGLGGRMMGGKSQYALTNIGDAIPPTLKDDADFMKELHGMQKDALNVQATIEQARRLEAKGDADAATRMLEDNRNRIEKFYERRAQVAGQIGSHVISANATLEGHRISADAAKKSGIAYLYDQYRSQNPNGTVEGFMKAYQGGAQEVRSRDAAFKEYNSGPNSFMLQSKYPTFEAYWNVYKNQGAPQAAGTFNSATGRVE